MYNQEIIDYIKNQQALGKSKDEIKNVLCIAGWKPQDAENAINHVLSPQPQTVTIPIENTMPAQNNVQENVTISNKNITEPTEEISEKPKIIKTLSILYWVIVITNALYAVSGGIVMQILNNATTATFTPDYSFVKALPFLPVIAFLNGTSFLAYFYAALKLPNGSKKAWKIAFFALLGITFLNVISMATVIIITSRLYSQISGF